MALCDLPFAEIRAELQRKYEAQLALKDLLMEQRKELLARQRRNDKEIWDIQAGARCLGIVLAKP